MGSRNNSTRTLLIIAFLLLYIVLSNLGVFNKQESNPVTSQQEVITTQSIENTPNLPQQGSSYESNVSTDSSESTALTLIDPQTQNATLGAIPEFTNQPFVVLNDNKPLFTEEEKSADYAFESYSDLDELGRCGVAFANICQELMPEESREGIGNVKPSGWNNVKYPGVVDGGYLYNRCHLIGFQLAGENANKLNLITGTRYLNVIGMLPYENVVANYVKNTNNHVLYRVTPIYNGNELVCRGLTMEAYSVEDKGAGVQFYVYCYNNQPYITINYMDGSSYITSEGNN